MVGASKNGEEHRGGLSTHTLFQLGKPTGGVFEGDIRLELFNLSLALLGPVNSGGDLIVIHVNNHKLFLQASS